MLEISQVRSASSDEWDHFWSNCSYSTYFHSREWAETWQEYTNSSICPEPRVIIFTDGKKALLPLSRRLYLKKFIKYYFSSTEGTYGGWISCDDLKKEHAVLLVRYLTWEIKNLSWRINPYDPKIHEVDLPLVKKDKTQALNLEAGFESLWQKWKKRRESLIRNIQKAQKAGIYIKPAENLDQWKQYYDIYLDSLRRWGKRASSQYDWKLFQILQQKDSSNIILWLAFYQNKIVAGILCLYAQRHVVYWHGAALEDYFKYRPVNLLMAEAIKNACLNTYLWFDFNPSSGHEGVWKFKKSFVPQELECPVVTKNSIWYRLYSISLKIKGRMNLKK